MRLPSVVSIASTRFRPALYSSVNRTNKSAPAAR
jgi:hypothetical protein